MFRWVVLLFSSLFLLLDGTYASERLKPDEVVAPPDNIKQTTQLAEWLKLVVPSGKYSCALEQSIRTVAPGAYSSDRSVANANAGMNRSNLKLLSDNSCFSQKAMAFWTEIEGDYRKKQNDETLFFSKKMARPTLRETAGQGRFKDQPEGWLWKKALTAADGHGPTALRILGLCLNDDTQVQLNFPSRGAEGVTMADARLKYLQQMVEFFRGKSLPTNAFDQEIGHQKELLSAAKNNEAASQILTCPNIPEILVTGTLDPSFKISDQLKNDIEALQKKDGPAKNYHYVGAALLGCSLAKCGIGKDQAGKIAKHLARAYRALRLCPRIKSLAKLRQNIEGKQDVSYRDPAFQSKIGAFFKETPDFSYLNNFAPPEIRNRYSFSNSSGDFSEMSKEIQTEIDSAILFSKAYLGGPDSLSGLPCTGIGGSVGSAKELTGSDWHAEAPSPFSNKASRLGNVCNITGWSIERCETARKRFASWDVDFQWTGEQHRIGAEFGYKTCEHESEPRTVCAKPKANPESNREADPAPVDGVE